MMQQFTAVLIQAHDGHQRMRIQLYRDVLTICRQPAPLWQIIRLGNSSYPCVKAYTEFLWARGFLRMSKNKRGKPLFVTTEKGHAFIEAVNQVEKLLNSLGE